MEEHGLSFTLLSEPAKTLLKAYDVWKERSMFGRPVMAILHSLDEIIEHGDMDR